MRTSILISTACTFRPISYVQHYKFTPIRIRHLWIPHLPCPYHVATSYTLYNEPTHTPTSSVVPYCTVRRSRLFLSVRTCLPAPFQPYVDLLYGSPPLLPHLRTFGFFILRHLCAITRLVMPHHIWQYVLPVHLHFYSALTVGFLLVG